MNNLGRVYKVYQDLDKAYEKECKQRKLSKLDFIKKIVAFDENSRTTRVDYIIDVLSEDSDKYTEDELIEFSKITSMLKGIDNLLVSDRLPSNDIDFSVILELGQVVSSNIASVTKTLPEGFFTKLTSSLSINMNSVELSLEDLVNSFGVLGEMFTPTKVYTLKKDTPKYFIYNDIISLLKIKEILTEENKSFFVKVVSTQKFLESSPDILKHLIFLGDLYYTDNGDSLSVKIGNFKQDIKKTKSNTIKLKNCETYLVDLNLPSGTLRVVLA